MAHQFESSNRHASTSSKEEFTLYVNNLPEELNHVGLKQIFNHYGEILGYFYRKNASWAYITYGSYLEAERAIKDLHNRSPLHLAISFAKEKASNDIKHGNTRTPETVSEQYKDRNERDVKSMDKPCLQTIGRGSPLDIFKKVAPNPGLPAYKYTSNDDLLYPYPSDAYTYNPYQNTDPYASTNTLWARGQVSITQDGKRHVSLGRGYTIYEIPNTDPNVQNQISKVYEKRTSGLYEYGKDMLQNSIGMCKKCPKVTKLYCETCHTFYCSRNCQLEDWPRHKLHCEAIPALVQALNSVQTSNEEQTSIETPYTSHTLLRRPKKLTEAMMCSEPYFNTTSTDQKEIGKLSLCQGTETKKEVTAPVCQSNNSQFNRADTNNESEVVRNNVRPKNIQSKKIEEKSNSPSYNNRTQNSNHVTYDKKFEYDPPIPQVAQTNDIPRQAVPAHLKVDETVQVSRETSVKNDVPSPSNEFKNIVNVVTTNDEGNVEIHAELSNNTYSVTLLSNNAAADFEKLLLQLPIVCERKAQDSNHRPKVGELVCGKRLDGDWLRGYVLSLDFPLKMAIIDEARMMTITKTVPCPENFLNICAFGATCEIADSKNKFNASDQYDFKVISQKCHKDEIEIEMFKDQDKFRAIVKPWVPMPEQKGVPYAELNSGSEVCVTAYRSQNVLFVRSLHTTEMERYNRIMQSVAKCAQTASPLKEPPVVGHIVLSQFVDDNYYRAIVTNVKDEKIAISYIDFGNTEVTSIEKLKFLSDSIKELRSCTKKIILKDVPGDVSMTKEANDYLTYLVGTEVPLTCTFDGEASKNGVFLKLSNGENVNEKINNLLTPSWKKNEEDKTCYMMDDLSVVDLGKVGDIIDAFVLYSFDDGYEYALCSLDHDLMTHVFNVMPGKITAYCDASSYYIPRDKELCLALYENVWYRACCTCRNETPTKSSVFFVDYGNFESVNHKDIRLMPKDFMTPNALANICKIVGLAPTDSKGRYSTDVEAKVTQLISVNELIQIKIVAYDEKSGMYSVELPLIRTILLEEGLISD